MKHVLIEKKGEIGKVYSVAHAAYNLARHMGCSPIILVLTASNGLYSQAGTCFNAAAAKT